MEVTRSDRVLDSVGLDLDLDLARAAHVRRVPSLLLFSTPFLLLVRFLLLFRVSDEFYSMWSVPCSAGAC